MKTALFVLASLCALSALMMGVVAKTSIHEIYSAVWWLTAAVLFGAGGVVAAVDRVYEFLRASAPKPSGKPVEQPVRGSVIS